MTTLTAAGIVHRFYAAIDGKHFDAVPDLFTEDWVNLDPALPPLSGHDGARTLMQILTSAFPDFSSEIVMQVEEGEKVGVRARHRGTHLGDFMGVPPTGKAIDIYATGMYRLRDNKICENRVIFDAMGMLQQIGVIPAQE